MMDEYLNPERVKQEIYSRIEEELKKTKAGDLRRLIYEKPWCTGGKGEEVSITNLEQKCLFSK